MAGIASGAISGSNGAERLANASIGMQVAENAVENNYLSHRDEKALKKAIENGESIDEVHEFFKALSEKQRAELLANCDMICRATVP